MRYSTLLVTPFAAAISLVTPHRQQNPAGGRRNRRRQPRHPQGRATHLLAPPRRPRGRPVASSEKRRVGEEGRSRWGPDHSKKKEAIRMLMGTGVQSCVLPILDEVLALVGDAVCGGDLVERPRRATTPSGRWPRSPPQTASPTRSSTSSTRTTTPTMWAPRR